MINIMILYICSFSSFSSHVTCFQEWSCKMCDSMFHYERNHECHKKICCGMNWCDLCGNVYRSKKSLHGHKRKHHTDDVCHFIFFVENVNCMNFSHIWCRCELRIFHDLHDMVFYYREKDMRVMKPSHTDVKWIIVWWCRSWLQHGRGWWFSRYTFTKNWQVICYEYMSYMSKCMLSFVYLNELFIESFKI